MATPYCLLLTMTSIASRRFGPPPVVTETSSSPRKAGSSRKAKLIKEFAVVAVKLVQNAGGVAQITKALVGGYTDTLGTISKT